MDTILAAMNRTVVIIEAVVVVAIVLLVIGIVVSSRRRKKASMPKPAAEPPNYYADLQQKPSGKPDPFGTLAAPTTPASIPSSTSPVTTSPLSPSTSLPSTSSATPLSATPLSASPLSATPLSASPLSATPAVNSTPNGPMTSAAPDLAPLAAGVTAPVPSVPSLEAQGAGAIPSWPPDTWSSGVAAASHPGASALDVQPATAPVAVAPAPHTLSPPGGTPAGWLPDPSGTPDTLRYWDGNAWTQHFAQRS